MWNYCICLSGVFLTFVILLSDFNNQSEVQALPNLRKDSDVVLTSTANISAESLQNSAENGNTENPTTSIPNDTDCRTCECWEKLNPGGPFRCKPECTMNTNCTTDKVCINYACKDPCSGACGDNALCRVIKHVPNCSCNDGYTGNPFAGCRNMSVVV